MTTITINERTKAGKTLLELAKILSASNKGVVIETGLKAPVLVTTQLTTKQRTLINRLKKVKREVDAGTFKGNSISKLMNEL
jgi:hypothetical protein